MHFFLIVLAAFLVFIGPSIALARPVCDDRTKFVEKLKNSFNEVPIARGISSLGQMVEVFASEKGTFSIVVTPPKGPSCLGMIGENWQNIPKKQDESKI